MGLIIGSVLVAALLGYLIFLYLEGNFDKLNGKVIKRKHQVEHMEILQDVLTRLKKLEDKFEKYER
jgi:deoxyadenosine/deoxycytidine kinase